MADHATRNVPATTIIIPRIEKCGSGHVDYLEFSCLRASKNSLREEEVDLCLENYSQIIGIRLDVISHKDEVD